MHSGVYHLGLYQQRAAIEYNCSKARNLLEFLFRDMPPVEQPVVPRKFGVVVAGHEEMMSLWLDDRQYYFGRNRHKLASLLVNEIIHDYIINNTSGFAIHAAACVHNGQGMVFPGRSGSGKSTLAARLALDGFFYLTDELVILDPSGNIHPFIRPISLTPNGARVLGKYLGNISENSLSGPEGVMVSPRDINTQWHRKEAAVALLIFPQYTPECATTLTPISQAQSCLKLLECCVNFRKSESQAFARIAQIVRDTVSYELNFSNLDDALALLKGACEAKHSR